MKAPLAPFAAAGRERIREVVVPKAKRREVYAQNDEIAFGIKPVFATLSCPPTCLSQRIPWDQRGKESTPEFPRPA